MTISLTLLDSVSTISKNINRAIAQEINSKLNSNTSNIVKAIKKLIPNWIESQPEMVSLTSPSSESLIGQFGITKSGTEIVNSIVNAIVDSTNVQVQKYNDNLSGGGLIINIQPVNFANLLSLPDGHTFYERGDLHWLEWLLLRGGETIVMGYEYNPQTGLGRSRLGNMIVGDSFRVPPQFSGTAKNNFVTRALYGKSQESEITAIFQKFLGI